MTSAHSTRILFVCLGNICRSPAAEAIMGQISPDHTVDSAGTSGWHVGDPPYAPIVSAAARRGIDMRHLRGRRFAESDFGAFDLIIAMDRDNAERLEALRPASQLHTPVRLLMDFAPHMDTKEVPDPYYTRDFDGALDLIEAGCAGLKEALATRGV